MELGTLLPFAVGQGGAIAVLIWVVWMTRKDLADTRAALAAERRRADSAEEAARTTNALLQSLIERVRS